MILVESRLVSRRSSTISEATSANFFVFLTDNQLFDGLWRRLLNNFPCVLPRHVLLILVKSTQHVFFLGLKSC